MVRMEIYGVSFDLVGRTPIVLLKTVAGDRFLPIWIGPNEAQAILMKLQDAALPRPTTHDLAADLVKQLGGEVVSIAVTELKDSTFYAAITVRQNGNEIEVDSRPSDAIAIALRVDAPIFVADEVIEESGVEFEGEELSEEEMVDQFKQFIETVSPEEFALGGDVEEESGEEGEEDDED